MKFVSFPLLMLAFAAGAVAEEELNIVATTSDLASIAQSVAGSHAVVRNVCKGDRDPHFLQAKPGYIMMARDADLWIRVGMELEIGWEPAILDGARNSAIRENGPGHLDASQSVLRLEVPAQRVTRAMGDVHAQGNPHYWLDPLNGRIVAKAIAGRLEQIDPFNAASYRANLAQFQKALDERMFGTELVSQIGGDKLWAIELKGSLGEFLEKGNLAGKLGGWAAAVKPLRAQKIVTYHKSWVYFANRFGLAIDCELEPKPGIPPSPSHLARVIERINGGGIRVILLEPFYSRKAADFVAGKTSATTVVCPNSVGGNDSATDYLSLIDTIVDRVSKAFTER